MKEQQYQESNFFNVLITLTATQGACIIEGRYIIAVVSGKDLLYEVSQLCFQELKLTGCIEQGVSTSPGVFNPNAWGITERAKNKMLSDPNWLTQKKSPGEIAQTGGKNLRSSFGDKVNAYFSKFLKLVAEFFGAALVSIIFVVFLVLLIFLIVWLITHVATFAKEFFN